MINQLLYIAIGGALGSVMRFLAVFGANALFGSAFPYGVLLVNVLGSFCAGVISVLCVQKGVLSASVQALMMIGFLGAFTTFSAFSLDTIALLHNAEWLKAFANIVLNLSLCLSATFIAIYLTLQLSN